ncbi:MAG: 2-isopropylmalate synthase [Acidobacteria bacterium RIFCSPLOWO2_12_FULL_59_11]|nr:MAG: 2-isopropylmalate synthase [Acidobacteria bacterium RIFCSPLOWO2_12_FULL_59_11]
MAEERVKIFDTTLRDGEQSPGCSMNTAEKKRMAKQLEELGVDILEAGFPIASEGDFAAVREVATQAGRTIRVAALARAARADIERAAQALEPAHHTRIHVFLASSDIHLKHKLRLSREQALERIAESVQLARRHAEDVEFSCEDATRTDRAYLCECFRAAVEAGATTLNIPDTVGYTMPDEYARIIRDVRQAVGTGPTLSVHCHDDLGLAVANSLAAVDSGARQVECTINGIGERAGNAALEEIVMALRVRQDLMPYGTGVRAELLYPTSQLLSELIGVSVQPNKAIVGRNAFAHEAGIHQDGVLKLPLTYEIMTPQSVGVPTNRLVLGKHSGRHALQKRYEELGHRLEAGQLNEVYRRFIELADRKKVILDEDLLRLLHYIEQSLPTSV